MQKFGLLSAKNRDNNLTQEQKLALRLKQIIQEAGLHEIKVYVTPEKVIEFWVVETKEVEGLPKKGVK